MCIRDRREREREIAVLYFFLSLFFFSSFFVGVVLLLGGNETDRAGVGREGQTEEDRT